MFKSIGLDNAQNITRSTENVIFFFNGQHHKKTDATNLHMHVEDAKEDKEQEVEQERK